MNNTAPCTYWLIPVGLYAGVWIAIAVAVIKMATKKDEASKIGATLFSIVGLLVLTVASLLALAIIFA